MPFVKATTTVFVENSLREEGEEFEYNGPKNPYLEPLDGAKPKESTTQKKWTPKARQGEK